MLDYKRESNGYRAHGSLGQFTKALSFTTVRSRLRCSGSTRSLSLKSRTWLLPHISATSLSIALTNSYLGMLAFAKSVEPKNPTNSKPLVSTMSLSWTRLTRRCQYGLGFTLTQNRCPIAELPLEHERNRGIDMTQSDMFSYVSPEKQVPKDHLL